MPHSEIYRIFKEIFGMEDNQIEAWFMNGKNSIRIRGKDKLYPEMIFTYYNIKNFSLETRDMFLDRIKKNK